MFLTLSIPAFSFQYIILLNHESLHSKLFSVFSIVEDAYGFKPKNALSSSHLPLDSDNGNKLLTWLIIDNGISDGQFNSPTNLAIDSNDNVYVADTGNNRIQKFDNNGNFITKWGGFNSTNDQKLGDIELIAIDSNNIVYVVDGSEIKKFDNNGTFLIKWEINRYRIQ